MIAPRPSFDLVVELVFVRQVVDEPGPDRVFRQEGAVIDELPHLGDGLLPPLRDAAHELAVEIAVERLRHLAVRRREGVLGEGVRRRLVVADVDRVRQRADLVEGAAQEQLVVRHAGEVERRRRHQEDLVAGAGEVVLLVAAGLEEGDDRLLGLLEGDDGVTHLLDLAPERGVARRPQHDAGDPRVDGRLAQRVDDGADRRRRFEQLIEHAGGLVLEQVAVDLEHQRRVRRDLRPPPHRQADEDEAEDGHGDRHENEHEHDDHTASYSHVGLLEDQYSWEGGREAGWAADCRLKTEDCRLGLTD